ncbi:transposase [Sphingomonas psychrotolerans]|uniref:Transposase n=1 Tax=Sphingomonas psychrotolerans TaxID=1327635 RepID=A0A2K8MH06_9SPHN|nr:transposase [Sphingomonas psychrotolerans]ATY33157.1 transposase [Sphingomonas psychrotolerans]
MPRLIAADEGTAIGLDGLVEALDRADFDARDEDSIAALGPLLARLGRNPDFLADLAIDELKRRCEGQHRGNGYGAQVFLLRPPNGRYVLRANFWPARDDPLVRASGPAAFYYDLPHDHNFPFLTYGYLGPGYWSDYFEYDVDALAGVPGEDAGLRFVERSRLEPGKLMLYRMRRDIHVQLPPDAFSVSLNILGADPTQPWLDQYRFDIARGVIAEGLTCTGAEALLAVAVHIGNGADLAAAFARNHPCERMRVTALDALTSALPSEANAIFESAAGAGSRYVAGHARARLAMRAAP